MARELEKDGYKMHRLYLAGYLKALADLGILKEKEIPPSKVYTTSANLDKTLYESVGDKCKNLKVPDTEKVQVATFILQRLFKRPIFLFEIKMCGLDGAVIGSKTSLDEKNDIRGRLLKVGLRIPNNDPAYTVEDVYENEYENIVSSLLIEKFDAHPLIVETKQIKLDEISKTRKGKPRVSKTRSS